MEVLITQHEQAQERAEYRRRWWSTRSGFVVRLGGVVGASIVIVESIVQLIRQLH